MNRPEDRYVKLETKTLPDGRVVYKSARPRAVDTTPDDVTVTADAVTRMDIIANNVYGDAADWWKVAAANHRVDGSLFLKPGTSVKIPKG